MSNLLSPALECTHLDNFIKSEIREQFKDLGLRMCNQFRWERAQEFQVNGALLQLVKCDAVIHVGTGRGKTAVVAAPHVLDENREKITVLVSPLIALQSEMEISFEDKYQLQAVALNSTLGAKLTENIRDILAGRYRIILVSPESLLSHRVRGELLANHEFKKKVFSIVIDEAHVIAYWGREFRKKYSMLHIVRDYLPGVPVICLSATLTPRVIHHITSSLHMHKSKYALINEGNERPELSLVVRKCEFPMNTFLDFLFLFIKIIFAHDIPKTFIFIDNKKEGRRAVQILNGFLPLHLRRLGLIRPFNAHHSPEYRAVVMQLFQLGIIRILICTDAAGMGCDISDVEIVIQWRVVALSLLIQRWGRIRGRRGLAVLFAEPSAYTHNPTEPGVKKTPASSKKPGSKSTKSNKEPLKKGGWKSTIRGAHPELRDDSPYEGTLALVQTNGCLREIWTRVFRNQAVAPLFECCSSQVCSPSLLDRVKPPRMLRAKNQANKAPKKGLPHAPTQERLVIWRMQVWRRDRSRAKYGASGILSDDWVDFLSSIGSIRDRDLLKDVFGQHWGLWDTYGKELSDILCQLDIPFTPAPPKPRGTKRKAQNVANAPEATSSQVRVPAPELLAVTSEPSSSQRSLRPRIDTNPLATRADAIRRLSLPSCPPRRAPLQSQSSPWVPINYPRPNLPSQQS
ncbi:DEAD/DEAH box helicase [Ceratobasidium sp. AG-Ba]|nr:DEAD/DEAH box helicase [Ceratobasidium sp. AG-Ba]